MVLVCKWEQLLRDQIVSLQWYLFVIVHPKEKTWFSASWAVRRTLSANDGEKEEKNTTHVPSVQLIRKTLVCAPRSSQLKSETVRNGRTKRFSLSLRTSHLSEQTSCWCCCLVTKSCTQKKHLPSTARPRQSPLCTRELWKYKCKWQSKQTHWLEKKKSSPTSWKQTKLCPLQKACAYARLFTLCT